MDDGSRRDGDGDGGGGNIKSWWWWVVASGAQLGTGIASWRRGFVGDSRLMPIKAFGIASLFVGSGATATFAALQASDIRRVEDFIEIGANIRDWIEISTRARKE
ncbi:hypothetical protein K2173_024799 [Erythroxylum novogranatense]|uniref:Uncharacterized protein n=1 Tax=Erythroxylum novogranatense TaxID=1862640 RepID=A0AAV8UDN2_9ROSI|nr:hypothetical protein K2173_024799 [Erythroxylum novogranatense]